MNGSNSVRNHLHPSINQTKSRVTNDTTSIASWCNEYHVQENPSSVVYFLHCAYVYVFNNSEITRLETLSKNQDTFLVAVLTSLQCVAQSIIATNHPPFYHSPRRNRTHSPSFSRAHICVHIDPERGISDSKIKLKFNPNWTRYTANAKDFNLIYRNDYLLALNYNQS